MKDKKPVNQNLMNSRIKNILDGNFDPVGSSVHNEIYQLTACKVSVLIVDCFVWFGLGSPQHNNDTHTDTTSKGEMFILISFCLQSF